MAQRLSDLGVERGDRLLLLMSTSKTWLEVLLGTWSIGAAVVPMAPFGPLGREALFREKFRHVAQTMRPKVVVAEGPVLGLARSETRAKVIDGASLASLPSAASALALPSPDDVALVQLTSGSTGHARGVIVRHHQLFQNVADLDRRFEGSPDDRVVSWLPLHHDMGLIGGLLFAMCMGRPLHLIPTETFISNPPIWLRAVSTFRGTLSPAPTFAYSLLARPALAKRLAGVDLSCMKFAMVGAEPVYPAVLDAFVERFAPMGLTPEAIHPCYGLAEATLCVSMTPHRQRYRVDWLDRELLRREGRAVDVAQSAKGAVPIVSNGPPMNSVQVEARDANGARVPDCQEGELHVWGPTVSEGYFGEPARAGWLKTGDLGFMREGHVYVTGRSKDLIIRGGVNIHPQEVEWAAEQVAGIRQGGVAAFSVANPQRGRDDVIVIAETRESRPEQRGALAETIRLAVTERADVQVDRVELITPGSIPKTSSGKVQRRLCRELYENQRLRGHPPSRLRGLLNSLFRKPRSLWAQWRASR